MECHLTGTKPENNLRNSHAIQTLLLFVLPVAIEHNPGVSSRETYENSFLEHFYELHFVNLLSWNVT